MFPCLIAVLLFCFSAAALVREPLGWVFAATGVASFLIAAGIAIFAIVLKPDLPRSERYSCQSVHRRGGRQRNEQDRPGCRCDQREFAAAHEASSVPGD